MFKGIFPYFNILTIIRKRNIQWLCHFTPRENIDSIKKYGLVLRDQLPPNSIITDYSRYDQKNNSICLSISKPNVWMFNKKREQGLDLCLLLINPSILYTKKCLFYPHNAATACYKNRELTDFMGANALENLFAEIVSYQKSGKEPSQIYRHYSLDDCETTSDQAEIQCLETIEPIYIEYIIEDNVPLSYSEIRKYSVKDSFALQACIDSIYKEQACDKQVKEEKDAKRQLSTSLASLTRFTPKQTSTPTEKPITLGNIINNTLDDINDSLRDCADYWNKRAEQEKADSEFNIRKSTAEVKIKALEAEARLARLQLKLAKENNAPLPDTSDNAIRTLLISMLNNLANKADREIELAKKRAASEAEINCLEAEARLAKFKLELAKENNPFLNSGALYRKHSSSKNINNHITKSPANEQIKSSITSKKTEENKNYNSTKQPNSYEGSDSGSGYVLIVIIIIILWLLFF